ncbi:MAG: transposase zinc-binding domain-containing protein [Chitinivibrionales bacterium]|nr:transposase zinc-binding domain-containing protein [Chitinivibrionales bacterium]
MSQYFDEFERVYPEQFEKSYGFWLPIMKVSIEKYLKCGDLKEGFARVHCFDCGREYFLPYSCKQRCLCQS